MKNFTSEEYFVLLILVIFIGLILNGKGHISSPTIYKNEEKCIGHFMFKFHSNGNVQQILTPDGKGIDCE